MMFGICTIGCVCFFSFDLREVLGSDTVINEKFNYIKKSCRRNPIQTESKDFYRNGFRLRFRSWQRPLGVHFW